MAQVLVGMPPDLKGQVRSLHSKYVWRRPQSYYPQFDALCARWESIKLGQVLTLARNALDEGKMTPYDAQHFRSCFARAANRAGLFAGYHYITAIDDRELKIEILSHDRGLPRMPEREAREFMPDSNGVRRKYQMKD